MPKLHAKTAVLRRQAFAAAGKRCFLRRGFHAVSIRDIAKEAGYSLGNLYVHFPDKLAIYRHVVGSVTGEFQSNFNPLNAHLLSCTFPADLEKLAVTARELVEYFDDYFRLAHIDAVEFGGQHMGDAFSNLEERLRGIGRLEGKVAGGSEKSFAFTAAYLSFIHYFMLSRLFRATDVYRAKDEADAVAKLVHLFRHGVGQSNPPRLQRNLRESDW